MPSDLGTPKPQSPTPAAPKTSGLPSETSGSLTVWVPSDARVTINGRQTHSTGSHRQYVSHGLKVGLAYRYVVHVEVIRDGQILEDTRTVTIHAGQTRALAFDFNAAETDGLALAR